MRKPRDLEKRARRGGNSGTKAETSHRNFSRLEIGFELGNWLKKKPLLTGSRDLESIPTQPSPVGYLGFCARIGSAGCTFLRSDYRLRGALRQRQDEDARRCIFRSGIVCAGLLPAFFWSLDLSTSRSLSCACCYARAVVRVLLVESRPGGLRFWNLRDERSTFFCW